jgi:hypothetical protein
MLEKFDPVVPRKYRTVMERTRRLADGQMKIPQ